jgi:hypothetical protein
MKSNTDRSDLSDLKPELKLNPNDDLNTSLLGELQEFGKNVWIVEGPDVRDMGIMFHSHDGCEAF